MWNEVNRLIVKYEVIDDPIAQELVEILRGHRDSLGVDTPVDPISYEELMSYHLAFPPFFPNQKPFESDDDFFVRTHEMYLNPDMANVESIIDRRRAWFEEEMEKKRERDIEVKYYDASGWRNLPAGGLSSLTPYKTGTAASIKFREDMGEFARSGRSDDVAALFSAYLNIDAPIKELCLTSDDGSKLFLNDELLINNDGLHGAKTICAGVSGGLYKIDVEYFERGGHAVLVLKWGGDSSGRRVVPPRAWASVRGKGYYNVLTHTKNKCQ